MILLEGWLNAHRDEKKQREPISLPRPWDHAPDPVTTEEHDELLQDLLARSAMRDL